MNLFKKISLVNKITKAVKNVKKAMEEANTSDIYKEIKVEVDSIINALKRLANLVPEAKEAITTILDAMKN